MTTIIGQVTMEYNKTGKQISSLFESKMNVMLDETLKIELQTIKCCTEVKELEHNASLVLASFFNRMNKIELRDVETTTLKSTIDKIEYYDDTKLIKKAVMTYSFEE